jgi:site-specific DNA recombinase
MIAAVYARKSTEQNGVADEQKSVARQIEHARQYAVRKGWTVDEACIFVDDGISGAEFARRPGYMRLLNAVTDRGRPPCQVLIVSELSRLGRGAVRDGIRDEALGTGWGTNLQLPRRSAGGADSATDKFLIAAINFGSDIEREKSRQRAYDTAVRKARAGHVTGGRVFGYENVPVVTPDGAAHTSSDASSTLRPGWSDASSSCALREWGSGASRAN